MMAPPRADGASAQRYASSSPRVREQRGAEASAGLGVGMARQASPAPTANLCCTADQVHLIVQRALDDFKNQLRANGVPVDGHVGSPPGVIAAAGAEGKLPGPGSRVEPLELTDLSPTDWDRTDTRRRSASSASEMRSARAGGNFRGSAGGGGVSETSLDQPVGAGFATQRHSTGSSLSRELSNTADGSDAAFFDPVGEIPAARSRESADENGTNFAALGLNSLYTPDVLVVSVVKKWVNYGHRWDSRVLLLDSGVLKYYQGHGKKRVAVSMLMRDRECYTIGEKVKDRYRKELAGQKKKFRGVPSHAREDAAPLGEVHISVATLRISKSDSTKFTIYSGTKPLEIRTESTTDRQRWISMLQQAKSYYEGVLQQDAAFNTVPAEVDPELNSLHSKLEQLGASAKIMEVCTQWADALRQSEADKHARQQEQIMELQDQLRDVSEEKHILESTLLANAGRGRSPRNRGLSDLSELSEEDEQDDEDASGDSETDEAFSRHRSRISPSEWDEDPDVVQLSDHSDASVEEVQRQNGQAVVDSESVISTGSEEEFWDADSQQGSTQPSQKTDRRGEVLTTVEERRAAAARTFTIHGVQDRDALPIPKQPPKRPSLWGLVKNMVGRDISAISLPVAFHEPLGLLQRCAEDMEYSHLIDTACQQPDSLCRMAYVAAFAVSCYSATYMRTLKPFTPLLGETFEYVRPDLGFRYFAEKVVHHPMTVAWHAESFRPIEKAGKSEAVGTGSQPWIYWGSLDTRNKFTGRSVEVYPTGEIHLDLPQHGDRFVWSKVTTAVNNIMVGKLSIEHTGILKIRNIATGDSCEINFAHDGYEWEDSLAEVANEVAGRINDATGALYCTLRGQWHQSLSMEKLDSTGHPIRTKLWTSNLPLPNAEQMYHMTRFAASLNHETEDLRMALPPTDSRLRPDQRQLERALYDSADSEKRRMETKQRATRRRQQSVNTPHRPRWFIFERAAGASATPTSRRLPNGVWRCSNEYWEARQSGNGFKDCLNIFA